MAEALPRFAPALAPPGGDPLRVLAELFRSASADRDPHRQPAFPEPGTVVAKADEAARLLDAWVEQIRSMRPLGRKAVRDLFGRAADDAIRHPPRDWDDAAQGYLALAALYHGWTDLDRSAASPTRRELFQRLRAVLRFPDRLGSPREFSPGGYLAQLRCFRDRFGD
jgi:hypothetical protein